MSRFNDWILSISVKSDSQKNINREKLILADHDNLNGLARAAQGAYETFKASTENTDRLNALEAHIKSVGGKVESVPAVMDKLVSVLKINEKMLAPIHQTVPQHTAPNQTQIDQSYTAPQGSGSPAIECWNCKGNHFQVGCPLLPSLSRRGRGGNQSFRAQHRGSERGNGRGNFRQNNGRYSTPQGGYNQGSGFRGGWRNGGGQNNHSGGQYSNQDYTGTHRGGNSQQDVSPASKVNSLTKEQCVEVSQMMLQIVRTGKLTLGRQKITLSSERPIQECVLKGDQLEIDVQQDTQLNSFMVQGKHTLHYPMNRGLLNSHKPEEIVRELGLVEVFGYKDQSVSNSSEVHLEQAENCPIYNHQVCSQGNTENTAPIYSPEVVYPQSY